jgi:Flp pilus assembly pilin Flp
MDGRREPQDEEERSMRDIGTRLGVVVRVALASLRARETGQTLVEYALILALISVGTIAAMVIMTGKLNSTLYQTVVDAL